MRTHVSSLAVCCCLVPALALAAGAAELVGKWSGDGFVLELRADGSGTIADSAYSPPEPMRWRVQGAELVLTQEDEPVRYGFRLQGQSLRLDGGDLEAPVTLTRSGAAPAGKPDAKAKKPGGGAPAPKAPRAGSCAASCRYFLKCAQATDPQLQGACELSCSLQGYDPAFLGWFQSLDCPSAVAVIALLDAQSRGLQQGQGGTGGTQGGRSAKCDGCVWDGSECAWYSQGNWGSNVAYSGAVISCDRSCCR